MSDLVLGQEGKVATIELARPPHNFFDVELLRDIADALDANDTDPTVVVTLLCAQGRSFCAGADFSAGGGDREGARLLYEQAARIFDRKKLLVAAVGGPAVGGGLGLAVAADFRVASPAARFHANFSALGLHPGFALTATLPELIGFQKARELMMTARRIGGEEALAIGLVDQLSTSELLGSFAMEFAQTIASRAPLALRSIREALLRVDGESARKALDKELAVQADLFQSDDFKEGVKASAGRRSPIFKGC